MLPPHDSLAEASFLWGPVSAPLFSAVLSNAYSEVVHWRGNLFSVPHGNKGNQFVTELARLYRAYAEASALEAVALKATTVMCVLLLQRPHPRSQTKDHQTCLSHRLTLWSEGDISTLLSEGRTIQDRLRFNISHPKPRDMIKSFSDLMLRGRLEMLYDFSPSLRMEGSFRLLMLSPPTLTLRSMMSLNQNIPLLNHPALTLWSVQIPMPLKFTQLYLKELMLTVSEEQSCVHLELVAPLEWMHMLGDVYAPLLERPPMTFVIRLLLWPRGYVPHMFIQKV